MSHIYNHAEDNLIIAMKGEGKSWAAIAEAIGAGVTVKSVKGRIGTLRSRGVNVPDFLAGRWTDQERADLARMRSEGVSNPAISAALGRTVASVATEVKRMARIGAIKLRRQNGDAPSYTADEDAKIVKMAMARKSYAEIGRAIGATKAAIKARICVLRTRGALGETVVKAWSDDERAQLLQMRANNVTNDKIAATIGCTIHQVRREIDRLLRAGTIARRGQNAVSMAATQRARFLAEIERYREQLTAIWDQPIRDISATLGGMSYSRIRGMGKIFDLPHRGWQEPQGKPAAVKVDRSEKYRAPLMELWGCADLSQADIGQRLGINKDRVRKLARKFSLPERAPVQRGVPPVRRKAPEIDAIREIVKPLVEAGRSYREIGDAIGVKRSAAERYCKILGFEKARFVVLAPKRAAKPKVAKAPKSRQVRAPVVFDVGKPVRWSTGDGCSFVLGEGRERRYCDAPVHLGQAMCPEHRAICYVPSRRDGGVRHAA